LWLASLGLFFFFNPFRAAYLADEKPFVSPLDIVEFFATTFRTVAH